METETKPLWSTTRQAMGKTWTIGLGADDTFLSKTGGNCGRAQSIEQALQVNAKMPFQTRDETLLHEVLHVAAFIASEDMEEPAVTRLSAVLYAFLRGFGLWNDFPWPDKEESAK